MPQVGVHDWCHALTVMLQHYMARKQCISHVQAVCLDASASLESIACPIEKKTVACPIDRVE